jgi:hypothetical protein
MKKSTFSFKSCENRYPKSLSRSQSQGQSRSGNFLKVRARAGAETNSFGSTTLDPDPHFSCGSVCEKLADLNYGFNGFIVSFQSLLKGTF